MPSHTIQATLCLPGSTGTDSNAQLLDSFPCAALSLWTCSAALWYDCPHHAANSLARHPELQPHSFCDPNLVLHAEAADSAGIDLDTAMREAESPLQQEGSHPGTLEDWLPMSEKDAVQLHAVRSPVYRSGASCSCVHGLARV